MAKRQRRHRSRSQAKKDSPYKVGSTVRFMGGKGIGKIQHVRAELLKSGTVYDVTVVDASGRQYYLYGGQIDEVLSDEGDIS